MNSALAGIRDMKSWCDIRYADKLKYLKIATEKYPELAKEAARTAARLKSFHEHPKYEVFYQIKPLLDWLKGLKGLGITRDLVIGYLFRYRNHPAPLFFRNQNNPALCIGAEIIAKHCLVAMEAVGVNTHIFKAHSIRGATTTFL